MAAAEGVRVLTFLRLYRKRPRILCAAFIMWCTWWVGVGLTLSAIWALICAAFSFA